MERRTTSGNGQESQPWFKLATSAALLMMLWLWRPVRGTVWQIPGWPGEALRVVYAAAVVFTIAATFQVSHTDLFGLRQAYHAITRRPYAVPHLTRRGLHGRIRHPIMTGLLLVAWVTPHLSVGHLLLATTITGYIVIGTCWEERDLLTTLGRPYAEYRQQVPAFLPRLLWTTPTSPTSTAASPPGTSGMCGIEMR